MKNYKKPCSDFTIHITEEAKKFVEEHAGVSQIISDIADKVSSFFHVKMLVVELISDPLENYSSIRVNIVCNETLDEALEKLRQFDNNWWLGYEATGKNYVSVDIMLSG